ncbi:MAG TPA: molybdopterin-binding protein [Blastocatellia bacterium]|nr:molybdopterin-binding protein [Blastocatellia bacterium]
METSLGQHARYCSRCCSIAISSFNILAMRQKTAAIVVIGNEILTGKSQDKNASFLIAELYELGVSLRRVVIIPDEIDTIAKAVRECSSEFDYVFTSGGVGPTHDDVTIEAIARAFDCAVVRHPELEAMLRSYFGDEADSVRMRMADVPDGAELIREKGLRWPGLMMKNVYVLPGVPELFRSKFEAMRERFRAEPFHISEIYTREDEFDIAPHLNKVAAENADVEIGSYPVFTRDDYRVKITIESKEAMAVERARKALLELLDPNQIARVE